MCGSAIFGSPDSRGWLILRMSRVQPMRFGPKKSGTIPWSGFDERGQPADKCTNLNSGYKFPGQHREMADRQRQSYSLRLPPTHPDCP